MPALKTGSLKFLYGEYNVISYGRWDDRDRVVVIVNNNDHEKHVSIPVWEIGIKNSDTCQQVMETTAIDHSTLAEIYDVVRGKIRVEMKPHSAKIIKCKTYHLE